jgi:hypothetical protein
LADFVLDDQYLQFLTPGMKSLTRAMVIGTVSELPKLIQHWRLLKYCHGVESCSAAVVAVNGEIPVMRSGFGTAKRSKNLTNY